MSTGPLLHLPGERGDARVLAVSHVVDVARLVEGLLIPGDVELRALADSLCSQLHEYARTHELVTRDDTLSVELVVRASITATKPLEDDDEHVHAWHALRSIPPSWRCGLCRAVTLERPRG